MDDDLLRSFEAGEWVSTAPPKSELRRYREAARATLAKDQRVNVRLPTPVLLGLRARALEEGLPYQTLITSILHKYVTGRLAELPSRVVPLRGRQGSKPRVA